MDMITLTNLVSAAGTLLTGLVAGLFFGFSVAVIPGLSRLPDAGYLQSFQNINVAILNPVFLITFIAPIILLPVATWLQYKQGGSSAWVLMLLATLIYIIAVFGVTIAGNVPLNETLAKTDLTAAGSDALPGIRAAFEISWNRLHSIRTWANVISLALAIYACLLNYKK